MGMLRMTGIPQIYPDPNEPKITLEATYPLVTVNRLPNVLQPRTPSITLAEARAAAESKKVGK